MPDVSLCGVVGFVGPHISGALVLAATPEPLASSNPTSASSRDWIGELSNQLFGRIRNRLLRRGLELVGAPPTIVRGKHIEALTSNKECRPIVLRGPDGGKVCIWIDCVPKDGLPVALSTSEDDRDVAAEGSVLLF
jgi:CheY-specific phosphatase CheX